MGSRSGDLDPQLILYIMGKEGLSLNEATTLLNKHSGLMGISGVSSDMREIEQESERQNDRARLAFDMFCYRVTKYVGAYAAAMGGIDGIVFTGGIGENSILVREYVCNKLAFLGVDFDPDANATGPKERFITTPDSRTVVGIVPTNEELVIALDTMAIVKGELPPSMTNMARNKALEQIH
jgi:acetate kinase